jgi:hypothetical protein
MATGPLPLILEERQGRNCMSVGPPQRGARATRSGGGEGGPLDSSGPRRSERARASGFTIRCPLTIIVANPVLICQIKMYKTNGLLTP